MLGVRSNATKSRRIVHPVFPGPGQAARQAGKSVLSSCVTIVLRLQREKAIDICPKKVTRLVCSVLTSSAFLPTASTDLFGRSISATSLLLLIPDKSILGNLAIHAISTWLYASRIVAWLPADLLRGRQALWENQHGRLPRSRR